ncbi:MAG: oligosaccharide flippase family protein [Deltaproteobacteria bacterium]|nr:oligosaccharide flippase family protein [Deltaproteobacteria bacterium]
MWQLKGKLVVFSGRIVTNSLFNAASRIWFIAVGLFLTPLFISYLGDSRFGIWAIFWSAVQYMTLFDCGLGPIIVKRVAEFKAVSDVDAINALMTTVFVLYTFMGVAAIVLIWPLIDIAVRWLNIDAKMVGESILFFRAGLIIFLLLNYISLFRGFLNAFQRMDIASKVLMILSVPNMLLSYYVLKSGLGLVGLVLVAAGIHVAQLMLFYVLSKRIFPPMRFRTKYFSLKAMAGLLGFGMRFQVFRLTELISYQTDKLLLGVFSSMPYVTFYDLGSKVAGLMRDFPYFMLAPVFPAVSELHGARDEERLWLLYDLGSKYLFILTIPLLIGTLITAPLIIQAWLGYVSPDVHIAVVLLSIGYWWVISVGMVFNVGIGIGWVNRLTQMVLLQIALNLALSITFVFLWGYRGILMGTTIALTFSCSFALIRFCREFNRSLSAHILLVLKIGLANVLPAIAAFLWMKYSASWFTGSGRWPSIVVLLSTVTVYVAAYLMSLRFARLFDQRDLQFLKGYIPFFRWLIARNRAEK